MRAWRGDHYIGPAEILAALGDLVVGASWELRLDEAAPVRKAMRSRPWPPLVDGSTPPP